jgi:hypothetical protein
MAKEMLMPILHDRRCFLAALSSAGATGLLGISKSSAQEVPPETTTIRLTKIPGICVAPQYVAEELLKAEGFTEIKYVELEAADVHAAFAAAKVDVSMAFVAPFIMQVDAAVRSCCSAASTRDVSSYSVPSACGLFMTSRGARSPCQVSRRPIMCFSPAWPLTSELIRNAILNS